VTYYDHPLRVETVLGCVLSQELVGGSDIGKGVGPGSSFVADATVFEVRGGESFRREGGAEMARVVQGVFGSPESAVDVDDKWMRTFGFGQAQVEKLIWVGAVGHSRVSRGRRDI
jgi:hypothetical protein